jgi:cysteinyl-tRNA synthetase
MLNNAQNDIEKIQKGINMAKIQMFFNGSDMDWKKSVSQDFISAFENDLNFPEAVTLV